VSALRVLHVMEALEGGTARHLVDVVRTVDAEHHVAIPSRRVGGLTDTAAAGRMVAAGAQVHVTEMRRAPLTPQNAAALASLVALVRRTRPAVVHAHSSIGGALGRVAATATRVPRVYTPNGLAQGRAALGIERALGPVTDRLVATSESEAAFVLARRLVPAERLVTIPNGIEIDGWEPPPGVPDLRTLLGLDPGVPLVGTVSRLVAQKAPERFARMAGIVLAERPDAHTLLIGDGPLRDAVDPRSLPPGTADRFHHLPGVPDAGATLGQLDVFVLTSRNEGFPYAALEAMRGATAVVLTDVVGSREVLEDGVSGHLVDQHDVPAMARLVIDLLADEPRRRALAAAARSSVGRFDVQQMGRSLATLYAELAS
jgi:glycosyltransferase involved in cell wall biosynthesis